MKNVTLTMVSVLMTLCLCLPARAETFGSGGDAFEIEFVTIGNPGNADDTSGNPNPAGKVDYGYRIGKYEISEGMINKANAMGSLGIDHDDRGANKPATNIDWFEAAKFVNWLNTSTGNSAAYNFDGTGTFQLWQAADPGYNPNCLYRNSLAVYFLPSVDEWYKAAYYDPTGGGVYYDYPTGSNIEPTSVLSGTDSNTLVYDRSFSDGPADINLAGGLSPYGTMGQGGNAGEWEESAFDLTNNLNTEYRARHGSWADNTYSSSSSARTTQDPVIESVVLGFRVASVPEPSTGLLSLLGLSGCILARSRRRSVRG